MKKRIGICLIILVTMSLMLSSCAKNNTKDPKDIKTTTETNKVEKKQLTVEEVEANRAFNEGMEKAVKEYGKTHVATSNLDTYRFEYQAKYEYCLANGRIEQAVTYAYPLASSYVGWDHEKLIELEHFIIKSGKASPSDLSLLSNAYILACTDEKTGRSYQYYNRELSDWWHDQMKKMEEAQKNGIDYEIEWPDDSLNDKTEIIYLD